MRHPRMIALEETCLGIPVDFTNEGIRGLAHTKATSFPAQVGIASAWDRKLVDDVGHITGREARVLGYTNVYSPILDLPRDPRWGRTVECYSEEPYLTSVLGAIQVKAIQAEHVVSGNKAVEYIESKHHVAADYPEAVRQAVVAGLNIRTEFTMPDVLINAVRLLITDGRLPMDVVDARVRFTLTPDDLKRLDRDMKWTVEPGTFQVLIGASSEEVRLRGSFEIN